MKKNTNVLEGSIVGYLHRRSVLLQAPNNLIFVDDVLQSPSQGEVLLETVLGSVSVGTELARYSGADPYLTDDSFPMMTGYENLAIVRETGPGVSSVTHGNRVVATYGHRTHAIIHETELNAVPDGVPDKLALLSILAADAGHAVDRAELRSNDRVLITGAGAIGLLVLYNLRLLGYDDSVVVDLHADRLKMASDLGAKTLLASDLQSGSFSEQEFDLAFECSASPTAFRQAQNLLADHGRIVVVSDGNAGAFVLDNAFHDRELTVIGTGSHPDFHDYARTFFEAVRSRKADGLDHIFDRIVSFNELSGLFQQMNDGMRYRKPLVIYE